MEKIVPQVNILIVDDDKEICDYMETFLANSGYMVKSTTSPTEALEEVKNGTYHLMVLDLMMPKVDGIQLLQQVRKVDDDIAVIIFTGYPSLETAVASMKLDVTDYIKKPFNPEEFEAVLQRVIRCKGLIRTPEEQLHKVIGQNIRAQRRAKGLTLKQLSRRTSLSVSLLSQIERAESSASISSLFKISMALDTKLTTLFGDY